jgi:23S rRNA pseudouridine1911/1915/1917 synthase
VVAKNDRAHLRLAEQFENRTVEKEYFAVSAGRADRDRDTIDLPVGAHPYQRDKMAIRKDHSTSRPAQTFFEVSERFDGFLAFRVMPKTGRTHQIRLHLASIGCPVLCDRLYGGRAVITRGELSRDPTDETLLLDRQALHARRLKIRHPETGESLEFVAPLPADIEGVLAALREFRSPKR